MTLNKFNIDVGEKNNFYPLSSVQFTTLCNPMNIRVSLGSGPYTLILHTVFDGDGDSCALELQILFPWW